MKTAVVVGLLLFAVSANAQTTAYTRFDGYRGSSPTYAIGVVRPELEFWAFTLPTFPDLEIGKLFSVPAGKNFTVLAGGYAVSWPNAKQYFALPWVYAQASEGSTKLTVQLASYLPVNGGPTIFFSDESSVTYSLSKKLDAGVAAAFWNQPGSRLPLRFGPVIKAQLSKNVGLSARALLFGGRAADSFRLELTTSF